MQRTMKPAMIKHVLQKAVQQSAVAMVAQRLQKLSNAELVHIHLCHIWPTLMRHYLEWLLIPHSERAQ